jgi:hypothetical protein
MSYIGNQPAESYASFERQVFTIVNSQTAYTLTHAVTNENDIRLVVNNVVQEPGSGKAYTASGTSLTLSAALVNGTDEMYCVYLGRALQTVNPPAASVGNSQTAPTIITGQTAETSIATDDTILIHDTSASALRKMTRANFVSGIGGTNTPAFLAYQSSNQSISNNTTTTITFDTEVYDTDNAFASNTFTVPSGEGGKYFFSFSVRVNGNTQNRLYSELVDGAGNSRGLFENGNGGAYDSVAGAVVLDLSASDTLVVKHYHNSGITNTTFSGRSTVFFGGYKLIT